MGTVKFINFLKHQKMKIFAFIFAIAMGRGFGPRFPQFPQDNRFFLEAAAQEGGKYHGQGITSVENLFCARMIDIEHEGSPGEQHTKTCNMKWTSNGWGQVYDCTTRMKITACKMCRRAPV